MLQASCSPSVHHIRKFFHGFSEEFLRDKRCNGGHIVHSLFFVCVVVCSTGACARQIVALYGFALSILLCA